MKSPSPEQVRDLRERHGVSQSLLADLLHVSSRAVQFWEAAPGSKLSRDMPPGLFELALIKLGESPLSHSYVAHTAAEIPTLPPGEPRKRRQRVKRVPRPKPEPVSPERLKALRALARRSMGMRSSI